MGWVDSRSQRIWTRGAARNAAMQRTKFNPFAFPISVLPGCAFGSLSRSTILYLKQDIYILLCDGLGLGLGLDRVTILRLGSGLGLG